VKPAPIRPACCMALLNSTPRALTPRKKAWTSSVEEGAGSALCQRRDRCLWSKTGGLDGHRARRRPARATTVSQQSRPCPAP
jgi:hypothetical protein